MEVQPEASAAEAAEPAVIPYSDDPLTLKADSVTGATAVSEVETSVPASVLPFEGETPEAGADAITAADLAALGAEAKQEEQLNLLDEDEDQDSFSMSELVALASLVDEGPRASMQAPPTEAAPVAEAISLDDPAEIARRKVAELMGSQGAPGAAAAEPVPQDPAEIARQMVQKLASGQPSPAALEPAPTMSRAEQELLDKFRSAENEIRALRARFRAGQITREQMQVELRNHMVLEEGPNRQQVWWMMGVESDTWYRYENDQWVPGTPAVLALSQRAELQTSPLTSVGDLPRLPEVPLPASGAAIDDQATVVASAVQTDYESMPLPRAVPVRDPEATVPGTPGVYMDPYASGGYEAAQPTVASAAVNPANIVAAPGPLTAADAPPAYEVVTETPIYEKARREQQQRTLRLALIIAGVTIAGFFALAACGIITGVLYYRSLAAPWEDEVAALNNYQPQFRTARILAADGSVLAQLTSQQGGARDTIALADISPYMIHALISTENERFYDDPGWDAIAIGRAFVSNLVAGQVESGASTLTQQLARSLILQDTTVSAQRKLDEIVVASMIAQRYDKNFILELYLNEFFFGNQSYGVEAASQFYFNHSAADLNLAEAAMLVGLLQAPATYDPVVNREAAFQRMNVVLDLMARAGCLQFQHAPYQGQPFCVTRGGGGPSDITSGEVTLQKAIIESSNFRPRRFQVQYPHFVNYVQQLIEETFGTDAMYRGGYEIRTTLLPRIQDVAQSALFQQAQALSPNGVNAGAVLVSDPRDGAILAMVGSPDFNNVQNQGQNNFAFLPQQPGSSIKPVTYLAALEGFTGANGQFQYWTPGTIIWDVPTTYNTTPPYSPVNFDRQFHGAVPLRFALQNSYNVPAVKAYAFIGAQEFRDMATRLGLRFQETAQFGLPTALGADDVLLYDMIQAYGTIANDGVRVPLYTITGITDYQGNQVALPQRAAGVQAIPPNLAFLMQNVLSDNQARAAAFGLNSGLNLPGFPDGIIGAKTGTSNDNRDLWTLGFTNNTVVGVWMGRIDNNPTTGTTQSAAVPVWNAVMRAALDGRQPSPFDIPAGVSQQQICGDTGTAFDPNVNPNCTNLRAEFFLEGLPPPPANSSFVQTLLIDTWTGLRATTACPEYVETRTFANIDDPFAVQWLNSPQGQPTARQLGLPTPLEAVPQGECPPNQQPNVRITSPVDGQQLSGTVAITGIVSATNLNRYQLELAQAGQGDNFVPIAGPFTGAQTGNATLMEWNTSTVPNGIYRLRLAAIANNGGYIYKVIQIGVNNISLPTALPAPLPTAAVETPIPPVNAIPTFDVIPAVQATLAPAQLFGPTSTPGVIPFGGLMPLATQAP
jgi:membrane peptidoglycan carboxypeptidase